MSMYAFEGLTRVWPEEYAEGILDGRIVACGYMKSAARRFMDDLEREDVRYTRDVVADLFDMVEKFHLRQGVPYRILPFHGFVLGSLYGFEKRVGDVWERKYRWALVETGKGSGKQALSAIVAVKAMLDEWEKPVQVPFHASKYEQTRAAFSSGLVPLVKNTPELADYFNVRGAQMATRLEAKEEMGGTGAAYRMKNCTPSGLSGPASYTVIADEMHEYTDKNLEALEMMSVGAKETEYPLVFITTNAGEVDTSPYYAEREQALRALEPGNRDRDSRFVAVCAIDEDDDPEDRSVWPKANPCMPYLPTARYLRVEHEKAQLRQIDKNRFLRLSLGVWTRATGGFIDKEIWDRSRIDKLSPGAERHNVPMIVALDLGRSWDTTAGCFMWIFPDRLEMKFKSWAPASAWRAKGYADLPHYADMKQKGILNEMRGDTTDYREVVRYLNRVLPINNLIGIVYDDWGMTEFKRIMLDKGLVATDHRGDGGVWMVSHAQANEATKRQDVILTMPDSVETTRKYLRDGLLKIEFNPLLRGAVMGAQMKVVDQNTELEILDKPKCRADVDTLDALFMACGFHKAIYEGGMMESQGVSAAKERYGEGAWSRAMAKVQEQKAEIARRVQDAKAEQEQREGDTDGDRQVRETDEGEGRQPDNEGSRAGGG